MTRITIHDPLDPGEYTLSLVAPPEPEPEPPPQGPWLAYRTSADGEKLPLEDATLAGEVWVSLEGYDGPGPVLFRFNGAEVRTESNAPWDFAGSSSWDSSTVSDHDEHTISASWSDGSTIASFAIDNVQDEQPVEPPPVEPDPPPTVASADIQIDGITFDFTAPAVLGPYANGDYAVLGPVTVAAKWPAWTGSQHGAQVNPLAIMDSNGRKHGYDSTYSSYSDAVRAKFPLVLQPGQSLVGVTSWRPGEPGAPSTTSTQGYTVPVIRHAAVLTCVSALPAAGDFRPPYCGDDKGPVYNVAQMIDLDTLPKWTVPSGAPSISGTVDAISRLWLDHKCQWTGRAIHPSENMGGLDYGRDLSARLGDAMLYLCCNISVADKREIAIRLIQIGIDQRAVIASGAQYGGDGGSHGVGRRGPVIVAGYLLGDAAFQNFFVGRSHKDTQESTQIARDEQGIYWREHWSRDRANPGSTNYEELSSPAWMPHFLVMRALGLEDSWSWPDSGPYMDAYQARPGQAPVEYAIRPWHRELWVSTDGGRHAP